MLFVLALVWYPHRTISYLHNCLLKDLSISTKIKKTSKVANEELFDKVDQAAPVESLRTQEGHWQTVKRIIPSEQK
jgi:hypothetical protein